MQKLTGKEIESKLTKFKNWEMDAESGKLVSGFGFGNFREAMDFAQAVGDIAEELKHHPDLMIHDFKFVTVFTSSHDVEGISNKDFELISKIEEELVA